MEDNSSNNDEELPEYLKVFRLYKLLGSELKVTELLLFPFLFTKNLLLFLTNNQIKSSDTAAILHLQGSTWVQNQQKSLKKQKQKNKKNSVDIAIKLFTSIHKTIKSIKRDFNIT